MGVGLFCGLRYGLLSNRFVPDCVFNKTTLALSGDRSKTIVLSGSLLATENANDLFDKEHVQCAG